MLVEMAIADAYGIGSEFLKPSERPPNDLSGFRRHPKYAGPEAGQYTDDTQRCIGNAMVLLGGDPFDPLSYATMYVKAFRRDPRKAYSSRYQEFLEGIVASESDDAGAAETFLGTVEATAASNGAIMGVSVLGFLRNPEDVARAAAVQAKVTHADQTVPYAQAIALIAHHALHGRNDDLEAFIASHVGMALSWDDYRPPSRMSSESTYKAVRTALLRPTLAGILHHAVEMGGDTDSVAAISVAIGAVRGAPDDIPFALKDGLEKGPYGTDYLSLLEAQLRAAFRTA